MYAYLNSIFDCHFVSLVGRNSHIIFFYFTGQLYGLEKFWAFRKYYKNWPAIKEHVDPFLLTKISEYKTVDDFRLDVSGSTTLASS